MPLKSKAYSLFLSPGAATLCVMKLADLLILLQKEKSNPKHPDKATLNSEIKGKELHALQYLGGYVLHNLFRKVKNSVHAKSHESQQTLLILEMAKVKVDGNQNLINCVNRGGLWAPIISMEKILVKCELEFKKVMTADHLRKIDVGSMCEKLCFQMWR